MTARRNSLWETVQWGLQQGIKLGIRIGRDMLTSGGTGPVLPAGRPATTGSTPTAHRAREIVYAPNLNGRADPGEVVWTWVAYEDHPDDGKDRPVLVVGRDHRILLGLMLSSQPRHQDDANWLGIGAGSWDYDGRSSWVRLDRILDVPEEGIRREGAILNHAVFETVAARLRADYGWS